MTLRRKDKGINIRSSSYMSPHHNSIKLSPQNYYSDAGHAFSANIVPSKNYGLLGGYNGAGGYNGIRNRTGDEHSTNNMSISLSSSPQLRTKLPPVSNKMKPAELFYPCKRHNTQAIKFIEISQGKCEGLCDICMVNSEFTGKNMKLERLVDIYEKKRKDLVKSQEELKDLEVKIAKIYKEIVKTNVMVMPLMKEMEEMEKRVAREVERCFKKLKAKFLKFNPFKDTREIVMAKLEESQQTLEKLDEGNFVTIQALTLNENKIINDNKNLIKDIESRIQMNTMTDPLKEKDFNLLVYEFERFFEKIETACRQFAQVLKVKT